MPWPQILASRMIEIAEALGQETDFMRVDLYDIDGRVVELSAWWALPPGYLPR